MRCRLALGVVVVLGLLSFSPPSTTVYAATACTSASIPAGVIVTPECTWIAAQYDPGVWIDNLGQLWIVMQMQSSTGGPVVETAVKVTHAQLGK